MPLSEFMFLFGVAMATFGAWASHDSTKRLQRSRQFLEQAIEERQKFQEEIDAILHRPTPTQDPNNE